MYLGKYLSAFQPALVDLSVVSILVSYYLDCAKFLLFSKTKIHKVWSSAKKNF